MGLYLLAYGEDRDRGRELRNKVGWKRMWRDKGDIRGYRKSKMINGILQVEQGHKWRGKNERVG